MSALSAWNAIPPHLRGGLARYLVYGCPPGSFLKLFLDNDLAGAVSYASEASLPAFRPLMVFLSNYAPRGAFGSLGCTDHWLSLSDATRRTATQRAAEDAFDAILNDSGITSHVAA